MTTWEMVCPRLTTKERPSSTQLDRKMIWKGCENWTAMRALPVAASYTQMASAIASLAIGDAHGSGVGTEHWHRVPRLPVLPHHGSLLTIEQPKSSCASTFGVRGHDPGALAIRLTNPVASEETVDKPLRRPSTGRDDLRCPRAVEKRCKHDGAPVSTTRARPPPPDHW